MPPDTVVVPLNAFATNWEQRPTSAVCMGLRFVADTDLEDARIEAFRRAASLFPNHTKDANTTELFVASFKDALIRWVIARGTCDPNDAMMPWEGWHESPEDITREALTDQGAQFIFDAWERMRIANDIATPLATDADIALLGELSKRLELLAQMDKPRELRCRRLLRFVLEQLEAIEVPDESPSTDTALEDSP